MLFQPILRLKFQERLHGISIAPLEGKVTIGNFSSVSFFEIPSVNFMWPQIKVSRVGIHPPWHTGLEVRTGLIVHISDLLTKGFGFAKELSNAWVVHFLCASLLQLLALGPGIGRGFELQGDFGGSKSGAADYGKRS